ncbi:MAG: UbiA prenyltransferase family protein [Phycisphaerales bacterium JB059]
MDAGQAHVVDEQLERARSRPLWRSLIKLARPHQWSKSAFVFIGPVYALADGSHDPSQARPMLLAALLAAISFSLASSGCYVVNDLMDIEADRAHPRKRRRPIACGAVRPGQAKVFAVTLLLAAGLALIPLLGDARWVGLLVGLHVLNVLLYSVRLKHIVILDVIILSLGFVLRVLGGCAAAGVAPSTWLLNSTLFLSMFLAFGKRLGERRTMGGAEASIAARTVQGKYSDELLRMLVVVTAVATLLTYAGYTQTRESDFLLTLGEPGGFSLNLLWLTILPAIYALIRAITLLERGEHDDPTELATKDRPFQLAAGLFALITVALVVVRPMLNQPMG